MSNTLRSPQERRLLAQCSGRQVCLPRRQSCSGRCVLAKHLRIERRGARCRIEATAAPAVGEADEEFVSLGPDPWNKTYYPKAAHADNSRKPWYIVDAKGQNLGRLATLVSGKIRGKSVPEYTASMDMGGFVIVINADKVVVTGDKENSKMYYKHSGRPGSLKSETFKHLQARLPERIVEKAVKGMLPKGRLGRSLFNHLKVFKGERHPHQAQMPRDITPFINAKPAQGVQLAAPSRDRNK